MASRYKSQAERRSSRRSMKAFWTSALAVVASAAAVFGVAAPLYAQNDGAAKIRVVKPFIGYEETYQWSDVPEIIAEGARSEEGESALDYAWASDLFFNKQIWQLQFAYKSVRTIDVNYPTADGTLQSRRIWYMVYSVTNTGRELKLVQDSSVPSNVTRTIVDQDRNEQTYDHPANNLPGVYKSEEVLYAAGNEEGAIEFVPRFVFATASIQERLVYERGADDLFYGHTRGKEQGLYYDSFEPIAFARIAQEEGRRNQTFLDSTRISNRKILPGDTVWGIAIWTDVDPRIDKFSVYVSGLSNALRWEVVDEPDAEQVGVGRDVMRKILKINFYSPGDEAHSGKRIYNKLPGELDYDWIWL
ncbi:MAG: hypothetical protein ACOX0A_10895 [Thermoguttaceae bacterium]|jgi:hypothetical protein